MSEESRFHERSEPINNGSGRSTVIITCPFCDVRTEAYLWSLAGSGKRCDCGAVHHYHPAATTRRR